MKSHALRDKKITVCGWSARTSRIAESPAEATCNSCRKKLDMIDIDSALYVARTALESVQREQDSEGKCLFCRVETEAPERLVAGHIEDCPGPLVEQAISVLKLGRFGERQSGR